MILVKNIHNITEISIKKSKNSEKLNFDKDIKDNDNIYYKINNNYFEKEDSKILEKYILNKDNDSFVFDGKYLNIIIEKINI